MQVAKPRPSGFLLLFQLPLVEGQLLAFENVTISAAALPWSRGNGRKETTTLELLLHCRVQLLLRHPGLQLAEYVTALLLCLLLLLLLLVFAFLLRPCGLLFTKVHTVLLEIPLLEWLGVDLHNG